METLTLQEQERVYNSMSTSAKEELHLYIARYLLYHEQRRHHDLQKEEEVGIVTLALLFTNKLAHSTLKKREWINGTGYWSFQQGDFEEK